MLHEHLFSDNYQSMNKSAPFYSIIALEPLVAFNIKWQVKFASNSLQVLKTMARVYANFSHCFRKAVFC